MEWCMDNSITNHSEELIENMTSVEPFPELWQWAV